MPWILTPSVSSTYKQTHLREKLQSAGVVCENRYESYWKTAICWRIIWKSMKDWNLLVKSVKATEILQSAVMKCTERLQSSREISESIEGLQSAREEYESFWKTAICWRIMWKVLKDCNLREKYVKANERLQSVGECDSYWKSAIYCKHI